jgi:LAO/AO transport system kinase
MSAKQRDLIRAFRAGRERALARAISLVENEANGFEALLEALHDGVGGARRIGLTGPPGAGKSTLTAELARLYRDRGHRVGVIAVDPTSPFTGGALLGDRIRMNELATEPRIFIRSMASRGSVGGLATTTRETADLMDAFGCDRILLETVGVGQSELEIVGSADTTVVILVPESGDAIQAMKAGLMEVADIFVVNKADRPGADRLRKEIEVMKALRAGSALTGIPAHHGVDLSRIGMQRRSGEGTEGGAGKEGAPASDAAAAASAPSGTAASTKPRLDREPTVPWDPPVLKTTGSTGEGVEELAAAIDAHFDRLQSNGELQARRTRGTLDHCRSVIERAVARRTDERLSARLPEHAAALGSGTLSPYALARHLLDEVIGDDDGR